MDFSKSVYYDEYKDGQAAYVYMVRCEDNSIYTGIARDLRRRMREHYYRKKSAAKYTKSRQLLSLEMAWTAPGWPAAAKLEARIKRLSKKKKEALIREPELANIWFPELREEGVYMPCEGISLEDCLKEEESTSMDRLEEQISFLLEIDKQKEIIRQTYLADGSRKETDAEHAWHIAVMCMVLSEYANEPIDVPKTVMMLLLHDVIEIDAGDTYAYDEVGNATKRDREVRAAERIYGLLPEDQREYFRGLWDEFEAMETPEAKFANTLDKIQPVLLTDRAKGKSWLEHGVRSDQILKRNERTHEGSEVLWDYVRDIIKKNTEGGFIRGEDNGA